MEKEHNKSMSKIQLQYEAKIEKVRYLIQYNEIYMKLIFQIRENYVDLTAKLIQDVKENQQGAGKLPTSRTMSDSTKLAGLLIVYKYLMTLYYYLVLTIISSRLMQIRPKYVIMIYLCSYIFTVSFQAPKDSEHDVNISGLAQEVLRYIQCMHSHSHVHTDTHTVLQIVELQFVLCRKRQSTVAQRMLENREVRRRQPVLAGRASPLSPSLHRMEQFHTEVCTTTVCCH